MEERVIETKLRDIVLNVRDMFSGQLIVLRKVEWAGTEAASYREIKYVIVERNRFLFFFTLDKELCWVFCDGVVHALDQRVYSALCQHFVDIQTHNMILIGTKEVFST